MATVQRCLVLFLWFATCQLCFSSSSSSVFSSNSGESISIKALHRKQGSLLNNIITVSVVCVCFPLDLVLVECCDV